MLFLLEFQGVGIFVASKPTKLPQKNRCLGTWFITCPGSARRSTCFLDAKKRDASTGIILEDAKKIVVFMCGNNQL